MESGYSDISYLKVGTPRQQLVWRALTEHQVMTKLSGFSPALVSTICVGLDKAGSDLDILCCHQEEGKLRRLLKDHFGGYPKFYIRKRRSELAELVCTFLLEGFEIEIFSSTQPVEQQNGFRHFRQMQRIIELGGEAIRKKIMEFRYKGHKTEPAIALALGLEGDPYQAVMELENFSDKTLKVMIVRAAGES